MERPRLLPSASVSTNKVYTVRTIEEINEAIDNKTDMQVNKIISAYIGKWIRIEEAVSNVSEREDEISVFTTRGLAHRIFLHFDKKAWKEHLETIREGDRIIAEGKITSINSLWIRLRECEVINIIGVKKNQ